MKRKRNQSFFNTGLKFECTKCGKCCSGFPGYVYLSEEEVMHIANHLMSEASQFTKKYTKFVHILGQLRLSLIEKPPFDCVFYENGCMIYKARPYQCVSYPFWRRHIVSQREWNKLGEFCPGINRGILHSKEEIEGLLNNVPDYNVMNFSPDFLHSLNGGIKEKNL
jgi:Fe-S-cluster containining protein